MKTLCYLFTFLMMSTFATVCGSNLSPPAEADQAAIFKLVDDFVQKWNQHNPKEMASLWTEDGDLVSPWGQWAKNKAEVEQNFILEQNGNLKNTTMKQTIHQIRLIAPNIALIDVEANITGINAKDMPKSFPHHAVYLAVKQNGVWRIAAARAYHLMSPLSRIKVNGQATMDR